MRPARHIGDMGRTSCAPYRRYGQGFKRRWEISPTTCSINLYPPPVEVGDILFFRYRPAGADYIIAVGHCGIETQSAPWRSTDIIANFAPSDKISREQLAAILYRYAKYKNIDVSIGEDTNILSYDDAFSISEYAIPAFQWACGAGIVSGADGKLMPKDGATRAQTALMLQRFCS